MKSSEIAIRLVEDFQHTGHAGKLGQKSTERLLSLVLQLARDVESLESERRRSLAGNPGYD